MTLETSAPPATDFQPTIATTPVEEIPVAPLPLVEKPQRLASLDIFRGITIAAMMLVNNPGSWSNLYAPLGHAEWHGWTPTDLIFPFFLFIVGVATPFSLAKRSATGESSKLDLLGGIWARALSLVMLGLLLQGIPVGDALPGGFVMLKIIHGLTYAFIVLAFIALLFPWRSRGFVKLIPLGALVLFVMLYVALHFLNRSAYANGLPANFSFGSGIFTPYRMRFPGVLQRIGVCYGVAASIALFAGWRTILASAVLFMAIYSGLMLKAEIRDHVTGSLTQTDNFARRVDEIVFRKHNYGSYPDPEGLVSTLPAIASVLLGILVGLRLRSPLLPIEKVASVLTWGVVVTILGVLLSWWLMPINKKIWTPSFTVFTAGLGMLGLGAVYYIADVRGRRRWALPFTIFGVNAIAAFVFSGIIGRISSVISFTHSRTGLPTNPLSWAKIEIAELMHHAQAWASVNMKWMAQLDTPNNISLAYAIAYVLMLLVLMSILYVFKIFIKV